MVLNKDSCVLVCFSVLVGIINAACESRSPGGGGGTHI